jgi:serine/threonine protein kinase
MTSTRTPDQTNSAAATAAEYICDGIPIKSIEVIQPQRILKGSYKHDLVIIKINQDLQSLHREIQTLESLGTNPPYAVLYIGHMLTPSPSLVTKYFSLSLNSYFIHALDSIKLHQADQILRAVQWLHSSKRIVHCDLKPENILVLDKGGGHVDIKLCDFDSARQISEVISETPHDKTSPLKFTVSWVCPEIFYYSHDIEMFQNRTNSPLCATVEMDLFSLGLVLACTLSNGRTPNMTILPNSIESLKLVFDTRSYLNRIPNDLVSGECFHAVEKLWSFHPSHRGSIDEVLEAMSQQRRTILSNKLIEESRWRQIEKDDLEKKIYDLENVLEELQNHKLSSSPKLTELLADLHDNMSSQMKMHYGNYLENINDLHNDVIKGQRILEALQSQREQGAS